MGQLTDSPVFPKCPKCGEPARVVLVKAVVTCVLEDDGTVGKVIKGFTPNAPKITGYKCGGDHTWGA